MHGFGAQLIVAISTCACALNVAHAEPSRGSLQTILARRALRVGMHAGLVPFEAAGAEATELARRSGNGTTVPASDGRPVAGFDVDLARSAARSLGVALEIVLVDRFDELLPGLEAGRYDVVMSALTETLTRAISVSFSEPYFASGLQILVRDPAHFSTLHDLQAGRARVGVRTGTTAQQFAQSSLAGTNIHALPGDGELLAAIDSGALDAVVLDYVSARDAEVRGHHQVPLIVLEDRRFTVEHFAFAVRHDDRDWLGWLNLMLRESKSSGEFHKLAARYNAWFRSER
jgi:polar amino acid transport system substrate-binding protein